MLVSGRLSLDSNDGVVSAGGRVGEEAAVGAAHYLSRVSAETPVEVIAIPRSALQNLFDHHPELVQQLHYSLTSHFTDTPLEPLPSPVPKPESQWGELVQVIGWALAIVAPLLMLWSGRGLGVGYEQTLFLAMSVFALGIVLVGSGLTYRLALWVLRRAPASGFGYLMVALGLGLFLSPILPSIVGIGLFLFGVMTSSIHKINPAWIGLALLFSFFTLGLLSQKGFREKVDWPFLILVGGLVGLANTMSWLEVDQLVSGHLGWMGEQLREDFALFVLMLAGVIWLLRLVLPSDLALILTATVFLPLAQAYGISPWVVGFTILMLGDAWFFPYQAPQYLLLQGLNRHQGLYRESVMLTANLYLNGLRLAAVLVAIPFWGWLGIL